MGTPPLPGQPGPMPDHSCSQENFPHIQPKPPLMQLEAISSCPIPNCLGEDTNTHLTTTSFQVAVESNKASTQPPLLQAKQPQLPQPLLIRLVLQISHQLRCPSQKKYLEIIICEDFRIFMCSLDDPYRLFQTGQGVDKSLVSSYAFFMSPLMFSSFSLRPQSRSSPPPLFKDQALSAGIAHVPEDKVAISRVSSSRSILRDQSRGSLACQHGGINLLQPAPIP